MSHPTHTVKRAFDLAERLPSLSHVRLALKDEGYPSVEEHLRGKAIRSQLMDVIAHQRD